MAKFVKGSKEHAEAKVKAREELDARLRGEVPTPVINDSTVGHIDGPEGTWNTSGVELPTTRSAVRDVRPEAADPVSVEDLKEIGVPVRDSYDTAEAEAAMPKPSEADATPESTREELPGEAESRENAEKEAAKASKSK